MELLGPLITEAERFSTEWIIKCIEGSRLFHNLKHTQSVVRNCVQLAELERCSSRELEMLLVAAWFHDTGYVTGSRGHEQESVKIAMSFLKSYPRGDEFEQTVRDLILATRMPTSPVGCLQEILCDADMGHLGAIDYEQCERLLRREIEISEKIVVSDRDWLQKNVDFFQQHRYYTISARLLWDEQKRINLERLLKGL